MIIQCDFDGTIITNNLSRPLRERFANPGWQAIEAKYLDGHLTVEESNRRQFRMIKEPKEALQSFVVQNINVRPGFADFLEYCCACGLRLAIVSSGLDFYIEPVLESIGLVGLEVYCARTSFGQDGIAVQYSDPKGQPIRAGFKRSYLEWFRQQGQPIAYIGDGLSDLDAARASDYIFATDHLHKLLEETTVPHYTFSSFTEIIRRTEEIRLHKSISKRVERETLR